MTNAYSLFIVFKKGFEKHNREFLKNAGVHADNLERMLMDYQLILSDTFSPDEKQTKARADGLKNRFNAQNYIHTLSEYNIPQVKELANALQDILDIVGDVDRVIESDFINAMDTAQFSELVERTTRKHGITYNVDVEAFETIKFNVQNWSRDMTILRMF